ncbi:MAG: tetratricopeptide repeat protein [Deltaproteobacteria bacterium]|nr:tetratricopeptide repeat protein [Deltaproteobacteria bacterium]
MALLALGGAPGSALAKRPPAKKAESPRAQAIQLFQESRAAYRQGRFRAAAALLEKAYALDPAPTLLYNLARALESDGDFEGAVKAYQDYLAADPKADDRAAIAQRIENLQTQIAEREELQRRLKEAQARPPPGPAPAPAPIAPAAPGGRAGPRGAGRALHPGGAVGGGRAGGGRRRGGWCLGGDGPKQAPGGRRRPGAGRRGAPGRGRPEPGPRREHRLHRGRRGRGGWAYLGPAPDPRRRRRRLGGEPPGRPDLRRGPRAVLAQTGGQVPHRLSRPNRPGRPGSGHLGCFANWIRNRTARTG